MRSLALVTLVGVSAVTLVTAFQRRDEGQLRIALDVDLVVFNVTVTDGKGRHVSGLTRDDLHVTEDTRAQDITLFSAEDAPATVGLVIDHSGSMSARRADVATAALAFVRARNPDDETFVVTFNEQARLALPPSMPFSTDPDQIRAALLRTAPTGLTALYDALALGIAHVRTGTRDRKALVVLSDGGDNASHSRLDDVLALAQQSSATVYTIGIYDDSDPDRNPRVLRQIAGVSGGRAYFPQSLDDLEPVWRDVAGAIRDQYTIGYYSTNHTRDGLFRRVTITAGRHGGGNLRVATREGYRAPSPRGVAK